MRIILKAIILASLLLMNSCFGIEDDEDWRWLVSFEDESGQDIFIRYDQYNEDSVTFRLKRDVNGEFSETYPVKVRDRNSNRILFYQSLRTGISSYLPSNGRQTWYYFDYGNGDVDTIFVEALGNGDYPCWCDDGFQDIDVANFYFNGELTYAFDFKIKPGIINKSNVKVSTQLK